MKKQPITMLIVIATIITLSQIATAFTFYNESMKAGGSNTTIIFDTNTTATNWTINETRIYLGNVTWISEGQT